MTRALTLKNRFQGNTTIVENDFIDHHMAKANGEYVKVYLLLLRHLHANTDTISIAKLADLLDCTEKDVLRAFKHWSKAGLLNIDYDEAGNICGLSLGNEVVSSTSSVAKSEEKKAPKSSAKENQNELRQLYFVAEQYIGKPLSATEIKKINYFFDSLNFSIDLIEFLIEYCVENGHRSFNYIESVALSWSDAGVQTVEEAKMNAFSYSKNCFSILNAFGIKGRGPAPAEMAFIKKWTDEQGFPLELILEACNRTINNTHKPDFKYTDTILSNWFANKVYTLNDVARMDEAYQKEKTTKKRSVTKPAMPSNRFSNFEGRSYDMNSLEQQLLNTQ